MVCVAVKEGGGDPALAGEIAREHPLPATTGGTTPHPLPATTGGATPQPLPATTGGATPHPLPATTGGATPHPLPATTGGATPHPLPATTGGATPHPLPATVGVSINVIHAEGMSPGSTGIITKLGMILNIFVGGYSSTDNDIMHPLSADRRDISPIDAAMSPGSGKSNNSTGIILGHIFLFNQSRNSSLLGIVRKSSLFSTCIQNLIV